MGPVTAVVTTATTMVTTATAAPSSPTTFSEGATRSATPITAWRCKGTIIMSKEDRGSGDHHCCTTSGWAGADKVKGLHEKFYAWGFCLYLDIKAGRHSRFCLRFPIRCGVARYIFMSGCFFTLSGMQTERHVAPLYPRPFPPYIVPVEGGQTGLVDENFPFSAYAPSADIDLCSTRRTRNGGLFGNILWWNYAFSGG